MDYAIRVHHAPDDALENWLALQQAYPGFVYQQAALARCWYRTIGAAEGAMPCIVVIEADGKTALMPLAITRWHATRILQYAGGQHFNAQLPLAPADFPWPGTPGGVTALLHRIADAVGGIDLIALTGQPLEWDGRPHPFAAAPRQDSGNYLHEGELGRDFERLHQQALSAERRKKARGKERRLADMGALTFVTAQDAATAQKLVALFLAQKQERFAAMGIPNPFAAPGADEFLLQGASDFSAGAPAILMQALLLDDEAIAIFGGVRDARRYAGMFTSFAAREAVARYSPGEHLLRMMVQDLCAQGVTQFDLGIGEARYKEGWCPRRVSIFSTYIALTNAGHVLRLRAHIRDRAKQIVKRYPKLLQFIQRLRR